MGGACAVCGHEFSPGGLRKLAADLAGRPVLIFLCPECAGRAGIAPANSDLPLAPADILGGLFQPGVRQKRDAQTCPACGTSLLHLRQSGRVGCMTCYETFREGIGRLLPRLSRVVRHRGHLPARLDPYRALFAPMEDGGEGGAPAASPDLSGTATMDAAPQSLDPALAALLPAAEGWRLGAGLDHPVVLSSRVELHRNAMEHPFPSRLTKAAAIPFLAALDRFFRQGGSEPGFPPLSGVTLEASRPLERWFRSERDELGCLVNQGDHFRLYAQGSGLCWPAVLPPLHNLESSLERVFPFAVNLAWGHLSSSLASLGTGLHARLVLHLPALVERHGVPAIADAVEKREAPQRVALRLAPLSGQDAGSLLELSNQETLGFGEGAILEQLAQVAGQLVQYERAAAERRRESDPEVFDDRAWREWGGLTQCRRLDPPTLWGALDLLRSALLAGTFGAGKESRPAAWRLNLLAALAGGSIGPADAPGMAAAARAISGNPD